MEAFEPLQYNANEQEATVLSYVIYFYYNSLFVIASGFTLIS